MRDPINEANERYLRLEREVTLMRGQLETVTRRRRRQRRWAGAVAAVLLCSGLVWAQQTGSGFGGQHQMADLFKVFFTWSGTTLTTQLTSAAPRFAATGTGAGDGISLAADINRISWVGGVFMDNTAGVRTNSGFVSNQASGSNAYGVTINGARFDFGAGASDYASSDGTTVTFAGPVATSGSFRLGTQVAMQNTAPTVSSGFGTSPSITTSNGTAAFTINVGTGGVATSGVIGLPTATNGWYCHCDDTTTPGANATRQTANSATTCTVTNVAMATGAATAWTASDILSCAATGR